MYTELDYRNELYHHGIRGQRWGVRRFQNSDGSYTNAGRKRYGLSASEYKSLSRAERKKVKSDYKIENYRKSLESLSERRANYESSKAKEYKKQIDDLKKNGTNSETWKKHVKEEADKKYNQAAEAVRNHYDSQDENRELTVKNMAKQFAAETAAGSAASVITKKYMQNNQQLMSEHLSDLTTKHKAHSEAAKDYIRKQEIFKNYKVSDITKQNKFVKVTHLGSNTRLNKGRMNDIYNSSGWLLDNYEKTSKKK